MDRREKERAQHASEASVVLARRRMSVWEVERGHEWFQERYLDRVQNPCWFGRIEWLQMGVVGR